MGVYMEKYKIAPIICVDFDGTLKSGTFSKMLAGPVPGAIEAVKELHALGCTLILWTCRSGAQLDEALKWLQHYGILECFSKINDNIDGITFTTSRKVYADFYVDDLNIGGFIGWYNVMRHIREYVTNDPHTKLREE